MADLARSTQPATLSRLQDSNTNCSSRSGWADSRAANYEQTAELDDGGCELLGCTDSTAANAAKVTLEILEYFSQSYLGLPHRATCSLRPMFLNGCFT